MKRIVLVTKPIVIFSLVIFTILVGTAFCFEEKADACREPLKKYLAYMKSVPYPKGEIVHYYKMRTVSVSAQDRSSTNVLSEMWVGEESKNIYKDPSVEYFRDRDYLFLVQHDKKQIVSSRLKKYDAGSNRPATGMDSFRDSLLLNFSITDCREEILDNHKVRFLSLKAGKKQMEQYKISRIDYYLSTDNNYLYRMVTYYIPGQALFTKTVDYLSVNYNDHQNKFKTPVRNNIYSGDQLQEKFRNYKIITQ